jgi:hypothetical protein
MAGAVAEDFAEGEAVGSMGLGSSVHELSNSNAAMASANERMESPDFKTSAT